MTDVIKGQFIMIIVISIASHYLLMLMAGPAGVSRLRGELRLAMSGGRKGHMRMYGQFGVF